VIRDKSPTVSTKIKMMNTTEKALIIFCINSERKNYLKGLYIFFYIAARGVLLYFVPTTDGQVTVFGHLGFKM